MILLLERNLLSKKAWQSDREEKEPVKEETMEEEQFRFMDFGENGFAGFTEWALENQIDPSRALAVWMMCLDYDAAGVKPESLTTERFEALETALLQDSDREQMLCAAQKIYGGLLSDLKVFPVPRNADSDCRFPEFEDSWGDPRTFGGDRRHEGCDIMGDCYPDGTYPVISMTDGVVEKLGWLRLGGWRVGIRSESGIYYYYAHLASYAAQLQVGQQVKAGELLGYMGSTGYSTVEGTSGNFAVHLHVGIYVPCEGEDVSVNPFYLLCYLKNNHVAVMEYPWQEAAEE